MAIEVVTAPMVEPLTTAEAKAHLRVDLSDEDALIDAAVLAARVYVENNTRLKLITQTVKITRTGFQGAMFRIPVFPVQEITQVQYKQSSDGALTTWGASNYQLVKSIKPYHLAPAYGLTWPTVRSDYDSVEVTVAAGFGDASTDIPGDILAAVKLMTSHFYENRQNEVAGTIVSKLSVGADRLLAPHVLYD